MRTGIDILEYELFEKHPQILRTLLFDNTTKSNIIWATNNYEHLGNDYQFNSEIKPNLIIGDYGSIIMPRVLKNKILQSNRSKEMAEVFTPSWVCNAQLNMIDNAWFGNTNVFNTEVMLSNGKRSWNANPKKVSFPKSKTWKDYVNDKRLEITCGEAPYITSRYDSTTGKFIPVENRIGIIDRKLRIVNENTDSEEDWLSAALDAFKSTYAFEWQGDNLLIARESLLITFLENYNYKFAKEPLIKYLNDIAFIISWNVWQMDGLKGVIPDSCTTMKVVNEDLFGNSTVETLECNGCEYNNIYTHNGKYCTIMDWDSKDTRTNLVGIRHKYVEIIKERENRNGHRYNGTQ
ncbi:MAG: restriction endonuclease subunit M [Candidatus Kapaibacteriota bacterium]